MRILKFQILKAINTIVAFPISAHKSKAAPIVIASAMAISPPAFADTINQSQSFSNLSDSSIPLTWNQFNPSLGTLTGISLIINGSTTGFFTVFNSDQIDPATLSNPKDRLRLTFTGSGSPTAQQTTQVGLSTTPPMPFVLPQDSSASFSLSPDPQFLGSVTNSLFSFSSYFTGLGTLSSSLAQPFTLTSDNSGYTTVDYSTMFASGSVSLIYTFQAVPEPSTYVTFGISGIGMLMLIRRKSKN